MDGETVIDGFDPALNQQIADFCGFFPGPRRGLERASSPPCGTIGRPSSRCGTPPTQGSEQDAGRARIRRTSSA